MDLDPCLLSSPLYKRTIASPNSHPIKAISSHQQKRLSSFLVPMANKQIVPYGSHLRKPSSEEKSLAIVPVEKLLPLAAIPPSRSYEQAYFVQVNRPALPPSQELLLVKDNPQRMKTIQVPKDVKHLPSKPNERLVDVKTNTFGNVTCVKYTTATP